MIPVGHASPACAIGPDADTHLGVLETQGLQITSRYEYHRELSRLAEMFPAKVSGEFTRHDIDRYLVARTVTGRKVSVSTRRKVMSVLSGFFRWATVAGLCPQGDPTQGMRRPPLQEPNPTAWTAEEVAASWPCRPRPVTTCCWNCSPAPASARV